MSNRDICWEIFCKVIDNYGDIGVCWRLARQLSRRYGFSVRLWVDDLPSFARLESAVNVNGAQQKILGVDVLAWTHDDVVCAEPLAAVVIEAFACGVPERRLQQMAQQTPSPLWVNLEYLSAESWVDECHLQTSIHPRLGLRQVFFFSGFSARSGGVFAEADTPEDVSFVALSSSVWLPSEPHFSVCVFAYEPAFLADWVALLAVSESPVMMYVPMDRSFRALKQLEPLRSLSESHRVTYGALTVQALPWTNQAEFDALLRHCDLNIVRGEDSFVRAQWAARPFLWNIYPTDDGAHFDKLTAFDARYTEALPAEAAQAWRRLSWVLNGRDECTELAQLWQDFIVNLSVYRRHAELWRMRLLQHGDLVGNLVRFWENAL